MIRYNILLILLVIFAYTYKGYPEDKVLYNVLIESKNATSYPAACDIDTLRMTDDVKYDQTRCFIRFKSEVCAGEKFGKCTANTVISIDVLNSKDANLSPDKNVNAKCFPANQALNLTMSDKTHVTTKESGLLCITSSEAYAKFNGTVTKIAEGTDNKGNQSISKGAKVESRVMLRRGIAGNVIGAKFGYKF